MPSPLTGETSLLFGGLPVRRESILPPSRPGLTDFLPRPALPACSPATLPSLCSHQTVEVIRRA
jgi:hypothetical protein